MLRTKFPCVDCGVPSEVRYLREASKARCTRHRERMRMMRHIGLADELRVLCIRRVNKGAEQDIRKFLAGWLEAVEHGINASRAALSEMP